MTQQSRNKETYHFFVDGKPYESKEKLITGAQLREVAQIGPKLRIFLEKHREENVKNAHAPDREIHNTYSIDLSAQGEEKFYTLPHPTMDIY